MIAVKINGTEYRNIASFSPSVVYDYYYSVKTMDGKGHRDIKGKRTNYSAVFFNGNLAEYDALKQLLLSADTVMLEVPNGAESSISGEYFVTVNNDNLKGLLYNGKYYNTALTVTFEKVDYDE